MSYDLCIRFEFLGSAPRERPDLTGSQRLLLQLLINQRNGCFDLFFSVKDMTNWLTGAST
jgi:hypothetical protein